MQKYIIMIGICMFVLLVGCSKVELSGQSRFSKDVETCKILYCNSKNETFFAIGPSRTTNIDYCICLNKEGLKTFYVFEERQNENNEKIIEIED